MKEEKGRKTQRRLVVLSSAKREVSAYARDIMSIELQSSCGLHLHSPPFSGFMIVMYYNSMRFISIRVIFMYYIA